MEDFIKFRLSEIEKVLATHVNEENPFKDEAEQLYAKLVNLQAQYAEYMRKTEL